MNKLNATTPIGKYLRKYRIDAGLNLKEMAEKIGISSAYLSSIEIGKKRCSDDFLNTLMVHYPDMNHDTLKALIQVSQPTYKLNLKGCSETHRKAAYALSNAIQELDEKTMSKIAELIETAQLVKDSA